MNKMVQILGDLDDPEEPKQLTELTEFEWTHLTLIK